MKKLILLSLSIVILTNCYAQRRTKKSAAKEEVTPVEVVTPQESQPEEPAGDPVITEECLINLSLFNESAKNKQYADALGTWNQVFENCPNANRAIYTHGRSILHWLLSEQTDDVKYQEVFNKLMLMYDKRMKYFGDDPRYPIPWIKGLKALDYIVFVKNDELKKPAYKWLEEAIDGLGEATEIEMIRQFVVLSDKLYANDQTHGEKYIADYLKANDLLETIIKNAESTDQTLATQATQYKNGLDIVFAESGAADCETLDELYKDEIITNGEDLGYLNKIISFYMLLPGRTLFRRRIPIPILCLFSMPCKNKTGTRRGTDPGQLQLSKSSSPDRSRLKSVLPSGRGRFLRLFSRVSFCCGCKIQRCQSG